MTRAFLIAGTIFGGLGVALGAFGAHGLRSVTSNERILHGFQTGVQYQVYHALALLATALIFEKLPVRSIKWAGNCFITGIILFSGSLYLLTFLKIQESNFTKIAGPITPIGGVFFILGWIFFLVGIIRNKQ